MARIFFIGGTGGEVINAIVKRFPDVEVVALVRDEGKAIQLKSSFPTIDTIIGDLSSLSLIEEASKDAGIVISKLLPHSYQPSSTQHFYTADISLSPRERSSPAEASPSKTTGFEVLPPNPPPSPKHLQLVTIRLLEASITRNIKLRQNYKIRRYVYVFTAPKLPGLAKVGITEDVGKRRRDLERDCQLGSVELQYMSKSLQLAPLAEKLTHGVLKAWGFGRTVKCPTENTKHKDTNHREWFACGKEMAVEVVKIWSEALEYDERSAENWLIERVKNFEKDGGPSEDRETWDQMMDRHRRWFRAGRGGRLDWRKVLYGWFSW
ncbi:hypothetical protein SLS56_006470 [Neofusicoccum ribis]|uniref:Bacteriophage T5 Orf172 DNA-binding domain-containing protein n=1 Tax=Neofusicoccum ribis TaxID=45134 RepID=A0ABR3SQQ5_9PEZI